MKKLTFNEFKEQISVFDNQIAIYNEFIETSRESDELPIAYCKMIITSLQIRKNKLVNNPIYFKYVKRMFNELKQNNR